MMTISWSAAGEPVGRAGFSLLQASLPPARKLLEINADSAVANGWIQFAH
jgi:hypothetical protein